MTICVLCSRQFESYVCRHFSRHRIHPEINSKSDIKWVKNSSSIQFPKLPSLSRNMAALLFFLSILLSSLDMKHKSYLFQDFGQIFWTTNDQNVVCSNFG